MFEPVGTVQYLFVEGKTNIESHCLTTALKGLHKYDLNKKFKIIA